MSLGVGSRVETEKNGKGVIAFRGPTQFSDGEWAGVILDEPNGKNNGTVQGIEYFSCEDNHGLFVRPAMLKAESKTRAGMKAPTSNLQAPGPRSRKPSPLSTPKMSPAGSVEKLGKSAPPRKASSSSRLAEPSTEQKPKMTRESSNLSQSASRSREASFVAQNKPSLPRQTTPPTPSQAKSSLPGDAPPLPEPADEPVKASVQSRVKKMVETSSVAMTPPSPVRTPMGMDEGTEMEYLRVQVKDLTEKLDTLRMKRKEDQVKLTEFERTKVQLQSLQDVRTKLVDQNLDVMRQLEEAKKEATDIREWRDANQEQMSCASEELEMALIDKEMAEERCEMLRRELDEATERAEELKADLEILREEMALAGGPEVGGVPQGNSVQMKQVEHQNERLKEALIKLRDLHAKEKLDREDAEKQLEQQRSENNELVRAVEQSRRAAKEAEDRIADYQEQVEAAMGADEMIVALSTKNLDMEDKISALEQEKEDMEALRDMDEQIAEAQKQVEKDLLRDIEAEQVRFNELFQKLKLEEKHSDDLMDTIRKFRQRTGELNEEIQDLKDQVLRYEEQLSGEQSEGKSMASMVSQLQVNAQRSFAESVERQVAGVELEFSKKQIGYLKAFLPDNFTKAGGDNDAVILNVLFPRLAAKSTLFSRLVTERFPSVPGGARREHGTKSHKAEQWAHAARVAYSCNALVAVSGQFESAIQQLSVERLARLSQLQPEMSVHEKTIDAYLELLKQGRFDENSALDNLDKAILYFQNVFSVHVGGDGFSVTNWLTALCNQLLDATTWAKMNTQRILYFLTPEVEGSEVQTLVTFLNDVIEKCQQLIVKASRMIPSGERTLKLTPQFTDELQAAVSNLERFCNLLHETCGIASVQININPELNGFDGGRLKEMIHGVVEKFSGSITLEKAFDPVSKLVSVVNNSLTTVVSILEEGTMEEAESTDKKSVFPPMLERAHQRKQAASEAEGLRWQLEKKDMEILELKKNIKSRLDDIGNYKLRLDMAEARMDSSGKQETTRSQALEAKLDQLNTELKKKTIEFDEQLDKLHLKLREADKENEDLKKNQTNMNKRALLQGIQSMESRAALSSSASLSSSPSATPHHGASAASTQLDRAETQMMMNQLTEAQQMLKAAQLEVLRLKAANAVATDRGGVLRIPDVVCGPETLRSHEQDDALNEIAKEAEQLRREEVEYLAFVPDMSRPKHLRDEDQALFWKNKEEYNYRVQSCRRRLRIYWAQRSPGTPFPLPLSLFSQKDEAPITKPVVKCASQEDAMAIMNKWAVCA